MKVGDIFVCASLTTCIISQLTCPVFRTHVQPMEPDTSRLEFEDHALSWAASHLLHYENVDLPKVLRSLLHGADPAPVPAPDRLNPGCSEYLGLLVDAAKDTVLAGLVNQHV